MGRFMFLKDKKFYLHLVIILLLAVLLFFATFWILKLYTRHDKVYAMPDFVGMDFQEVRREHSKDFNFIVIDSIYPKGLQPGSIFQQDPLPGATIKRGRNVYIITVAITPEKTTMPNLKGISLREAIGRLESSGLEIDHLDYVSYNYKNNIVEQYYQGEPIPEGTELVKGSKIVIKVGLGQDKASTIIKVPNMIGKPASEAKRTLNLLGLNLGKEVYEDNDSIQYQCVKQMTPGPSSDKVKLGTYIDVRYHSSRTLDFKKEMDELLHEDSVVNTPKPTPTIIDTLLIDSLESKSTDTIETNHHEDDYEDDF